MGLVDRFDVYSKHEQKQSLFMIETPIKTRCRAARDRTFDGVIAKLIKLANFWRLLAGSFSAASKQILQVNASTEYSFESSRRDLHNALLSLGLISQRL